jgi:hypothetical protein
MQQAFCTNCGTTLTPGAAFCPSCGTRVEPSSGAASAPSNTMQAAYNTPGAQPPAYSPPPMSPQQGKPPNRTAQIVGAVGGCLVLFLVVVGLLIASLIYGITSHHLVFFAIGVAGLFVIILVVVAIEHIIRRLYRRVRGGVERLEHPGYAGAGYRSASYRQRRQQGFRPFRFLFTLVFLAAAALGGLFLYDTYTFNGDWSGTLTTGTAQQGILADLQMSLSFHKPANFSFSDLGAFDFETITFKPTTTQACNKGGSQAAGYQLSGTASRLDASQVAMTLTPSGGGSLQLQGSYQNGKFTLSGTSGGKPVTLTLQKGSQQAFTTTCQQLT